MGGMLPLVGAQLYLDACAWFWCDGSPLVPFLPLTVVCGMAVILGSLAMLARPDRHRRWGTIVFAFALVSIIGGIHILFFGLLGLILGVVGGALGITWRPLAPAPPGVATQG